MPFDLPAAARRQGIRRNVTLRPIITTQAQAADLAAILIRPTQVWRDAVPAIMAGYDPAPITDGLTTDSPASISQAIDAADGEVSRLVLTITAQLRDWALRMERWHRGKWIGAVNTATNIDLSTVLTSLPVQETLETWIERNVALVKDVSAQTRGRISDSVFRGYQARTPPREVAKEITEATGLGRKRAQRIAADQSIKLSAALDTERMAESGIEQWKYRSSHKKHFRPDHAARDGKIYDLSTNKQVGGPDKIEPGNGPAEPPYCGCHKQAYLALAAEFGL